MNEIMPGLNYQELQDEDLLRFLEVAQQRLGSVQSVIGRLEWELIERMEGRGASIIPNEEFICEVGHKKTYLQEAFTPLKEIFTDADLAGCCTPCHEETVHVDEKWNTVKVIALARRYGDEAKAIVAKATSEGPPSLKFTRKVKNA